MARKINSLSLSVAEINERAGVEVQRFSAMNDKNETSDQTWRSVGRSS